jgi:hypothetical protein
MSSEKTLQYDHADESKVVHLDRKHGVHPLEAAALGRMTEEWQDSLDICRDQEFNIHVLYDLFYEGVIEKRLRWDYEIIEGKKIYRSAGHFFRLKSEI